MDKPCIELLAGPANPAKSQRLLELCAERVREGREGSFLFIVPSPQRVEQVNERLLSVAPQGFFKPHVDTFNGLIAMLYDLLGERAAPISDAVKAVLVQEILTTHADRFPFLTRGDGSEPFPGLVAKLCDLIADLKRSLVEPAHLAARGKKLPGRQRRKAEELAEFYRLYQERLQQHELMDGEGVFWLLIESLKRKDVRARLSQFDLLMLDGIHDLTVAEWRVLEGLVQAIDHTIVAIDYWPQAGASGRAAEKLYRDLLEAGAQEALVPPPEDSPRRDAAASGLFAMPSALREPWDCKDSLRVFRCNDRQHEVKAAGEQIKALVRGGADARRIVVATAELSHYTRLIR